MTLDGSTVSVDPSDAAFQALAAGETQVITLNYNIVDGEGGSVAQSATITITGTNDAPTVEADLTAAADEDAAGFDIDLLDGADDVDNGAELSIAALTGLVAGVTLDGSTVSVDPSDAAFQALAAGETQVITLEYNVVDGEGGSVAQTATITITGTNDAPTIGEPLGVVTSEDGDAATLDLLIDAADVDNGAVLSVADVTGLSAGITVDGTTLSVDPSNAAFQALAAGEISSFVISYNVVDGEGGSVAQEATVIVVGTNDAPTVTGALMAAADEDAAGFDIDLLEGADDVDNGAELSIAALTGLVAGVTLDGSTVSVDPSDAAFQALAAGETQVITLEYNVVDGEGGSVAQTATITITGTNDAPTVEADLTAAADEDSDGFTVDLLEGADDVDNGAELSIAALTGLVAGVTLDGSTVSVDPSAAAFQALAAGETQVITLEYNIVDGEGGSVAQTATITITGTNDDPTISGAVSAAADEDAAAFTVDLLEGANDVDNGAELSIAALTGLVAGVTLDGSTVSVDPSDAAFQALAAGETQVITLEYNVVDGEGGSVAQTATITITGTNDAPTISGAVTAAADEDAAGFTVDLLEGADDVDNGAELSVANVFGLVPGVTLDGASLSIDPSDAALQSLAVGESQVITLNYNIVDGEGGSVAQTATITITGTNDAPTVTALTETLSEDASTQLIDLLVGTGDVDNGAVLSIAELPDNPLPAGFTILDNELRVAAFQNEEIQALAEDDTLDITIDFQVVDELGLATTNSITLTFTGANDRPIVTRNTPLQELPFDEAYSFTLPANTFVDVDTGDSLTLSASVAGGGELPDWLSFDAATGTFSGTPTTTDGGGVRVVVTATDSSGESVSTNVTFAVGSGVILGTEEDNDLVGTSGADTFFGLEGNDRMEGLGGNDTYVIEIGDGNDIIDDNGFNGVDTVIFNGRTLGEATITRDGASNTITFNFDNGDSVELVEALDPSFGDIESVVFDDATLDNAALRALVIDTFTTVGGDIIFGTEFADAFEGGTGNDRMEGGSGNDTYTFNIGDGQDIVDDGGFNGVDTLVFNGRDLDDATFTRDGGSNTFTITFDNGDSVQVIDGLDPSFGDIESVVFDNTTLDAAGLRAVILDTLSTDGDDFIIGTEFGDTLTGGLGNDRIEGNSGNDTYIFNIGDGQDIVDDGGFNGLDTLQFNGRASTEAMFSRDGGSNTITISFANGDSVEVIGGLDNNFGDIEQVVFSDGTLTDVQFRELIFDYFSTDGDDVVFGTEFNDTLEGGLGNDTLEGLSGNDTYVFNVGDGQDTVDDNGFGGVDTIRFEGRELADATFDRPDATETVTISFANGDVVTIVDGLEGSTGTIETIEFVNPDGTVETLDNAAFQAAVLAGQITTGDDSVYGSGAAETIEAGTGNDMLFGGAGGDTYVFNIGDGQDTIDDNAFGGSDQAVFVGRTLADATFTRIGTSNDLLISFNNGDTVEIVNGLSTTFRRIETLVFDGIPVLIEDIELTVLPIIGTDAGETLRGTVDDDTLIAGLGDDFIEGRAGEDVYQFSAGDGADRVEDNGQTGETDTLEFRDYDQSDASFLRQGPNTVLIEFGNGDSVRVQNGLTTGRDEIEQYAFRDQTITVQDVRDILASLQGTSGDDAIVGQAADEIFEGFAGEDVIDGAGGDDFIDGGEGNDTLIGGTGNDTLRGGDGADTYQFASGDGSDVLQTQFGTADADRLVFTDYDLADATFAQGDAAEFQTNDLVVSFANGDQVRIQGFFEDSIAFDAIEFANDTVTRSDVLAQLIADQQTDGNDIIVGFSSDDTFDGGLGDDEISGNGGDDIYLYNAGDGADLIFETFGNDTINFGTLNAADAVVTNGLEGIRVDFGGGDSVTIAAPRPFGDGESPDFGIVESFVFADGTLDLEGLLDLVEPPAEGIVVVGTNEGETLLGTDLSDTLTGAGGNDTIRGGLGDDTYIYNVGDGFDFIDDAGGNDTLVLNGITPDDVFALSGVFVVDPELDGPLMPPSSILDIRGIDAPSGGVEFILDSIETFVFVPDVNNPDRTIILTYEELFGGDGGPGFPGGPIPVGEVIEDTDLFV
ncbi:VCBS domain-containing protein [Litorimonas sp. RW-G-Af-16]|uniref:VCBS domain-containing protein n=1 Tax=Litorimonas sp. RW-G-Af-16 TaxID=3241168 RepID=UPI003AB1020D